MARWMAIRLAFIVAGALLAPAGGWGGQTPRPRGPGEPPAARHPLGVLHLAVGRPRQRGSSADARVAAAHKRARTRGAPRPTRHIAAARAGAMLPELMGYQEGSQRSVKCKDGARICTPLP